MSDNERFNRIENTLERITEILAIQAAHDERIAALSARVKKCEVAQAEQAKEIQNNSIVTKVTVWLTATTVGAAIVFMVRSVLDKTGTGS